MNRIDVHCHFLPALDDGCKDVNESLDCLRTMVAHGYSKLFCTPHSGSSEFTDLTPDEVAERVRLLVGNVVAAQIPIEIRPGGELRLTPGIAEGLLQKGVPTFG